MASKLDANQCIQGAYNESQGAFNFNALGSFVPEKFTKTVLTYSGSDIVRIDYYNGANLVCQLHLTYVGGQLTQIERV